MKRSEFIRLAILAAIGAGTVPKIVGQPADKITQEEFWHSFKIRGPLLEDKDTDLCDWYIEDELKFLRIPERFAHVKPEVTVGWDNADLETDRFTVLLTWKI